MIEYIYNNEDKLQSGGLERYTLPVIVKKGDTQNKQQEEVGKNINEIVKLVLDEVVNRLNINDLLKDEMEIIEEITKKLSQTTGGNKEYVNELMNELEEEPDNKHMVEIKYGISSMYEPPENNLYELEEINVNRLEEVEEEKNEIEEKNKMEIFKNTSVMKMLKNLYRLHLKGKDEEAGKMMESILIELVDILNKLYKYETKMEDINRKYVSKYKTLLQDTLKLRIDKTECEEELQRAYNNNFKNQNNLFEEYDKLGEVIPKELLLI